MGVRETLANDQSRLFFEEQRLEDALYALTGGSVAVHSTRSPYKDSPNEDAAGIIAAGTDAAVLAVADGLGGAPAGREASSIAINAIARATRRALEEGHELRYGILNGFESANEEVLALGVGAATTLTVAEINGSTVRAYHVGDSFMLITGQRGKIKSQTIEHSPVGYAVESGLLNETEAIHHEDRHVISNVIGSTEMRIDVGPPVELAPKDTLVLATDGLSDNLLTPEIVELVRKGPLDRVSRALAERTQNRMELMRSKAPSKPDDLTFLIFRLR